MNSKPGEDRRPPAVRTRDRWRPIAAVASGLLVGILVGIPTAVFAFNVYLSAAWSNIHGGTSDLMLAMLPLIAIAIPAGSGFLAAWAMNRWLLRRVTPDPERADNA